MSSQQENLHNPKMLNPIREIMDPSVNLNFYPWANQMRETIPIYYDELRDGWNFFLYEDVHRILQDPITFSSRRYPPQLLVSQSVVFQDPPRHTDLRGLVNKAFTPKMMADLAPRIEMLAEELLDDIHGRDQIDIIEDLSDPLPVTVIAELLGVSPQERKMFRSWAFQFMQNANSTDPEELKRVKEEQQAAQASLFEYLTELIALRRQAPTNDLLSALVHAEVDGRNLSESEVLAFCSILLAAGSETTTNWISHTVRVLIDLPDVHDELRKDLSLLPNALEEVLRFRPSVPLLNRVASTDVEIKGHQIRKGQGIIAWTAAANRDPRKFHDPDRFIINRHPNPHLTFGLGVHFCLGAPLARIEALAMMRALFKRYKKFDYVPGYELEPIPSVIINGVKKLPVLCTHV